MLSVALHIAHISMSIFLIWKVFLILMLPQLINLVKNVGCQFTFGIFTKWDECIRKAREEGQQSIRNVVKTANDYMKEFCEVLQGRGKAYFVNVKNFENIDVSTKSMHAVSCLNFKFKCNAITSVRKFEHGEARHTYQNFETFLPLLTFFFFYSFLNFPYLHHKLVTK